MIQCARLLSLPVLCAALAGCANPPVPQVAGQPPPGIAYRFRDGTEADAAAKAEQYCARFGKQAKLQQVTRVEADKIGRFACE